MTERQIHLRIKIKSLVDEARTIRAEAKKTSGMAKWRLNHHRTTVVRDYARLNLLAYGILIGMFYERMEKKCQETPNFIKVAKIAKAFGGTEEDIAVWIADAEEYLKKETKWKSQTKGTSAVAISKTG